MTWTFDEYTATHRYCHCCGIMNDSCTVCGAWESKSCDHCDNYMTKEEADDHKRTVNTVKSDLQ